MELHSILVLICILSVIGLLTYFMTGRQKRILRQELAKQEPRFDVSSSSRNATEPTYNSEEYEEAVLEREEDDEDLFVDDDPLLRPRATPRAEEPKSAHVRRPAPAEEVICLLLLAKPNKPYVGYELLQALLSSGLRYGVMEIFHRFEDLNGKGKILFSVASASEPGTFEINRMGAYSGKGLMMFLRFTSNKDLMPAFDLMLDTAKQLVEDLDGDILDEERKILSPEKIEKLRKKITDFEQKQRTGDLFDQ